MGLLEVFEEILEQDTRQEADMDPTYLVWLRGEDRRKVGSRELHDILTELQDQEAITFQDRRTILGKLLYDRLVVMEEITVCQWNPEREERSLCKLLEGERLP